jgi:Malic enzyme, N-terminal domain
MEEDFLEQIKGRDIDLVVCSDSEAILGIGDQGVGVNLLLLFSSTFFLINSTFLGHWGDPRPSDAQICTDYATAQISTAKALIYR